MASWDEVQQFMRTAFRLDRDDASEFALTLEAGSTREQRIMVRTYLGFDKPMIEFRSAFGEYAPDEGEAVLRASLQLPLGGIALHGRFLVVVHREQLEPLSVQQVVFLLTRVSQLADELEERRGGDRY